MIIKVREAAETSSDTGGLPARLAGDADFDNVGAFRFWFVGQHWEWSDEVARMHGYEPGTVVLTTELLLSHKHPDDRRHVQDLLDRALIPRARFPAATALSTPPAKCTTRSWWPIGCLMRRAQWWGPPVTTST